MKEKRMFKTENNLTLYVLKACNGTYVKIQLVNQMDKNTIEKVFSGRPEKEKILEKLEAIEKFKGCVKVNKDLFNVILDVNLRYDAKKKEVKVILLLVEEILNLFRNCQTSIEEQNNRNFVKITKFFRMK